MPKLPDAQNLNNVQTNPVRSFTPIPNLDVQGAFNSVGNSLERGFRSLGGGLANAAQDREAEFRKAERFDTNMRLLEAESAYNEKASSLDPLAEGYPDQVVTAWDDAVKDILTGLKDPENKRSFGENLLQNRFKLKLGAGDKQKEAKTEKTQSDLELYIDNSRKQIRGFAGDPDTIYKNAEQMINDAPVDEATKRKMRERLLPKLDEDILTTKAIGMRDGRVSGSLPIVVANQPGRVSKGSIEGVSGDLLGRFRIVQDTIGKSLPIVSGYRDPKTNAAAGGARKSQHVEGNAIDIDVSGLSFEERRKLIEIASAQGITGIGVYKNSLHFDMGGRRAWGPTHRRESVPAWAASAIMRHESGSVRPQGGLPRDFNDLWSRLIQIESGGDQSAVSPKGAIGRAQIMPATGPEAARLAGLPWDPERLKNGGAYNEALGQAYLKDQLRRYNGDPAKAMAAYNAGFGRVNAAIEKGGENWVNHLPKETRDYLAKAQYAQGVPSGGGQLARMSKDQILSRIAEDPSFQRMSVDDQDRVRSSISAQLGKMEEEDKVAEAMARAEMKSRMDSDLRSIAETGTPDETLTAQDVAAIATPQQTAEWAEQRKVNSAIWDATNQFPQMAEAQIVVGINDMRSQLESLKGTPEYGIMQKVVQAAEAKHQELKERRRDDPFTAAEALPGIKEYIEQLTDPRLSREGEPMAPRNERIIETVMDAQRRFGFRREADIAPIPKAAAIDIGNNLVRVGFDAAAIEETDSMAAAELVRGQYKQLEMVYGKYTPDVIAYSLGVVSTMNRENRELLVETLTSLSSGKPLTAERNAERRARREAIKQEAATNGWGQNLFGWLGGDEEEPPATSTQAPVASPAQAQADEASDEEAMRLNDQDEIEGASPR